MVPEVALVAMHSWVLTHRLACFVWCDRQSSFHNKNQHHRTLFRQCLLWRNHVTLQQYNPPPYPSFNAESIFEGDVIAFQTISNKLIREHDILNSAEYHLSKYFAEIMRYPNHDLHVTTWSIKYLCAMYSIGGRFKKIMLIHRHTKYSATVGDIIDAERMAINPKHDWWTFVKWNMRWWQLNNQQQCLDCNV